MGALQRNLSDSGAGTTRNKPVTSMPNIFSEDFEAILQGAEREEEARCVGAS